VLGYPVGLPIDVVGLLLGCGSCRVAVGVYSVQSRKLHRVLERDQGRGGSGQNGGEEGKRDHKGPRGCGTRCPVLRAAARSSVARSSAAVLAVLQHVGGRGARQWRGK
jgi:hypothetical protein